jgi:REP element-mobilizing transposase RayT
MPETTASAKQVTRRPSAAQTQRWVSGKDVRSVPGYVVSTVGRDKEVIRAYIRNQEKEDERLEQLALLS